MSRSKWLVTISSALGILVIFGILAHRGKATIGDSATKTALPTDAAIQVGDSATDTALPTGVAITEKTVETVKVTQTAPVISKALSPTLRPDTTTPTLSPIPTQFLTPTKVPTVPTGIPVSSPEILAAATNLQAQPECSGTDPVAYLSWTIAAQQGTAQRIDVATFIGGFEAGIFETTGAFPPERSTIIWDKVNPGVLHFWRVLTLHEIGWIPSEVATFNGMTCIPNIVTTASQ